MPLLAGASGKRQVILCSHNANIAVLSGADHVTEMTADDSAVTLGRQGSIDNAHVATALQETLEGGKAAFERRQQRYGWSLGPRS